MDAEYRAAVAAQLRAELAAAQKTQSEIAEITGISKPSIQRYLRGTRDIPTSSFISISKAIGVDVRIVVDHALKRLEQ